MQDVQPVRLGIALLACCLHRAAAAAAPARAPIVVTLVIDQFPAWLADARWPLLPATGGFARLRREGTRATIAYEHAVTDTAPGHATLMTGAPPRESGIYANEILDPTTRKKVSVLRDPSTRVLAADGKPRDAAVELAGRAAPADDRRRRARRAPEGDDRVAVAQGSRGAARRRARADGGRVVRRRPRRLRDVDGVRARVSARGRWRTPGPDAMRAQYARDLDASLDRRSSPRTPPRPMRNRAKAISTASASPSRTRSRASTNAPHAFRSTPFADEVLLALAVDAIDAAPPAEPMLLALSLSANDYVGHVYGPDSWEAWDELERLDGALARFFAALDERFGAARLVARALGRPRRHAHARGGARGRARDARRARRRGCAPSPARTVGDGDFIAASPIRTSTSPTRRARSRRRSARALDDALVAELRAQPGIAGVFDARRRRRACAAGDGLDALRLPLAGDGHAGRALRRRRARSGSSIPTSSSARARATARRRRTNRWCRSWRARPGASKAGRVEKAPLPPASFAVTAARLLGVAPPPGARGGRSLAR